jgi:ParB family transcriptional regulator, chromosome partitioning protein
MAGNKGFAEMLGKSPGSGESSAIPVRRPPTAGVLAARESSLAALSSGTKVNRVHELIDPARCKVWEGHNRDYAALSEERCADLIDSFKAQGRQEVPAIVRRVKNDPEIDFEIICGARRHWSVSWMRAHDYPDFKLLVEIRELTDEEAFRVADIENRNRQDISDYERAKDYLRAIDRYYEGNQQRMVERLKVSKSWLSRYLELAKLPDEVIASFGSPHVIGIRHAAELAPLLNNPVTRGHVLHEAGALVTDQAKLKAADAPFLKPALVVRRMVVVAKPPKRTAANPGAEEIRAANGVVILRKERVRGGGFTLHVLPRTKVGRGEYMKALASIFEELPADAPLG